MQEHIDDRAVALSVKATKITGRLLAQAMRAFLKKVREPAALKQGKQSINSLKKHGACLSDIEITGDNIGSFKRIAREYKIDFSLKKDSSETPPKWMVFFKAKDADSITAAFGKYSKEQLNVKTKKPSLLDRLEKAKELVSQIAAPVKNRNKGGHEL
jgi:hypothetical protein